MDFILRLCWDYSVLNAIPFWCRRPSHMLSKGKLLLQTDRLKKHLLKSRYLNVSSFWILLDRVIFVTEGITIVSFRPSPYTGLSFHNTVCTISLDWGPRTGKERVGISSYWTLNLIPFLFEVFTALFSFIIYTSTCRQLFSCGMH